MTRIGVRELRQHASRYLDLVKAGDPRGHRAGRIDRVAGSIPDRPDRLIAAGRLVPATSPSGRLRSPRPVPIVPGEPTNQELLDAVRDDRL